MFPVILDKKNANKMQKKKKNQTIIKDRMIHLNIAEKRRKDV